MLRDVAACLEFPGSPVVKDSFVDDELRQSQSDLVFSVPLSETGEAIVYLLNDEQLRGQAFMHASLLLLKYILRPELPGAWIPSGSGFSWTMFRQWGVIRVVRGKRGG